MIAARHRIERIVPERSADFLAVFAAAAAASATSKLADGECGFPACHCHYYQLATAVPWGSLDADANRVAMSARIAVGEMDGFLAYEGHAPVGWLDAQPLNRLPHVWDRLGIAPPPLDLPAHAVAVVLCFVIPETASHAAVARALLDGAVQSFDARGLRRIYGVPRADAGDGRHPMRDRGSIDLFAAAGFSPTSSARGEVVMVREPRAQTPGQGTTTAKRR